MLGLHVICRARGDGAENETHAIIVPTAIERKKSRPEGDWDLGGGALVMRRWPPLSDV